jgi:glucosamine--fructose-6-phosphate aminotransferase (isomerizing)
MPNDQKPFAVEALTGNAYFSDVLGQPDALEALLSSATDVADTVRAMDLSRRRRIVLSGMGSSHIATFPLWLAFIRAGLDAWRIDAAQLLQLHDSILRPGDLLWLTSQSGESGEVVELLQAVNPDVEIVGVTNSPKSTLGAHPGLSIFMQSGPEATVSSKSLINTFAVSRLVSGLLTETFDSVRVNLNESAIAVRTYLSTFIDSIEPLATFGAAQFCLLTGRGEAVASAEAGSLILKESAKLPTEGMSGGDLRHGVIEVADESSCVIFFDHGQKSFREQNVRLAKELRDLGAKIGWVGVDAPSFSQALPRPDDTSCDPIIRDVLAFQTLSFAIASSRGTVAGAFRAASKITSVL